RGSSARRAERRASSPRRRQPAGRQAPALVAEQADRGLARLAQRPWFARAWLLNIRNKIAAAGFHSLQKPPSRSCTIRTLAAMPTRRRTPRRSRRARRRKPTRGSAATGGRART